MCPGFCPAATQQGLEHAAHRVRQGCGARKGSVMLYAYRLEAGKLVKLDPDADLAMAIWVDLYKPMPAQTARVTALGAHNTGSHRIFKAEW